ncbi:MAG: MFS transporter [Phycisphaerae bacterium]|nr:MFS transporter [Phycisphaerae bacterium]
MQTGPPSQHEPDAAFFEHPPGYRLRRFRNWFFLGLLYASYYLCRKNFDIVAPEISKEFGFTNRQLGLISSGRDGGYAVGQFVNGLFADRLGGKQAMALGALGTIVLNLCFGISAWAAISWMLLVLAVIRVLDGYVQAFGAPGMVKINAAWFLRRERGRFAGIFGGMIQLGSIGVGALGKYLLIGFSIPIIGLTVGGLGWRSMFFVPPAILLLVVTAMWLNVKNHPEDAGFRIRHEDESVDDRHDERLSMAVVFRKIAGNPLAWINAGAYFCTGFVRRALEFWWVKYFADQWGAGKTSIYFAVLILAMPISAFVGSFSSGLISDTLFRGRRSPVAALVYTLETACILTAVLVLRREELASPALACILFILISLTCNSSHSIIGTAAAMDLGGRKMTGFAAGVIDSFQYFGAILAGFTLGWLIDVYKWNALFAAMLPFSVIGATLMTGIWWKTRGRDVRGS